MSGWSLKEVCKPPTAAARSGRLQLQGSGPAAGHPPTVAAGAIKSSDAPLQVFASLRFTPGGPLEQARALQSALKERNVMLNIIDVTAGSNIEEAVFTTIENCDAFIAFGSVGFPKINSPTPTPTPTPVPKPNPNPKPNPRLIIPRTPATGPRHFMN